MHKTVGYMNLLSYKFSSEHDSGKKSFILASTVTSDMLCRKCALFGPL